MTSTSKPLASPCVRVCALDAAGALCIGCGRTIEEIAGWSDMSEEGRLAVMGELDERLRKVEAL
ncbi:DUF1289 domain-containing protein [Aureimonas phyllosphaerae]|uniref:DUF1289 domain-containing protein n=1 Tax=Aureimonas phyllosphaerae TaxID=1166078 RepID=UPI003A5C2535